MIPLVTVLIAGLFTATTPAEAQIHGSPGALDSTFGTGGTVITSVSDTYDMANAVVALPDGKVVAAGDADASATGSRDFALVRYNWDGSLDATFGTGGRVTTDFLGDSDSIAALLVQPDGKLVAAGTVFTSGGSFGNFGLARYNRDGSLDPTFGTGGKVITNIAEDDFARALVRQADGKLVVAGAACGVQCITSSFALARYLPNGTLDPSFGAGGVVTSQATLQGEASALVIQPDGKLVAGGEANGVSRDFALVRYNRDGSPDPSFGTDGVVLTDFGDWEGGSALVQQNGKLVLAGTATVAIGSVPYFRYALARYNDDGSLDCGFGTDGKVISSPAPLASVMLTMLTVQGGKLIAGGGFLLARYNHDGTLDTRFGTDGWASTAVGDITGGGGGLAWQPGGRLVVAGYAYVRPALYTDFALARFMTW